MTFIDFLPAALPWTICALSVILGTILQRIAGAGFGMIASPVMVLAAPDWVPGTVLLIGVVVGFGSFFGSKDAVNFRDLPFGLVGRVIGSVLAAYIAKLVVGSPYLPIVVGFIVLIAVLLSSLGLSVNIGKQSLIIAGAIGGLMATLTGIGAAPMAILYSSVEPRRSAATQNMFFGFGMAISIAALAMAGLITIKQLAFALSLAPFVPASIWLSKPLAHRVEKGSIRPWALGLATMSASILIITSM